MSRAMAITPMSRLKRMSKAGETAIKEPKADIQNILFCCLADHDRTFFKSNCNLLSCHPESSYEFGSCCTTLKAFAKSVSLPTRIEAFCMSVKAVTRLLSPITNFSRVRATQAILRLPL